MMYTLDKRSDDKQSNSMMRRILMLLCTMCIGLVIGQIIIQILLTPQSTQLASSQETYKQFLLTSQAIMSSSIFIVSPLLYWYKFEHKTLHHLFIGEQRYVNFIGRVFGLMISAMIVNTLFIYLNMQLKFPPWLAGFEKWAQGKEAALKQLTDIITNCHTFTDLLLTIVVIGVIPAIGEELAFRGILQNIFFRGTSNMHVAILLSAFIFSAIHLQIYGFLPRFLLGVLFGYLYGWTKNLAFPIVAHFLNNALTIIGLFLAQHDIYVIKKLHMVLPVNILLPFTIATAYGMYRIYQDTRYIHHSITN